MSGLGPSFKRYGHAEALREVGPECLNAYQERQRCQSSEKFSKFFGAIQIISCRDWWPWTKPGYITMTRRYSNNQWSGGIAIHTAPKNSEYKNSLEKFSPRFFGIKTASSSMIIFQKAKLSTPSITHLCWCNWRTFWRKNAGRGKVAKGSPGTCNPEETGLSGLPVSWSPTVFSIYGPSRTTARSLDRKNNWKVTIFHPTQRSLLPWRPGWMDNLLNYFWVACRS